MGLWNQFVDFIFCTDNPPSNVRLVKVGDKVTGLEWNGEDNEELIVERSLSLNFYDPMKSSVFGSKLQFEDLNYNTKYFVRVSRINSRPSKPLDFVTLGAVPNNLEIKSFDKEDAVLVFKCEGSYQKFQVIIHEVKTDEEECKIFQTKNSDTFTIRLDELEPDTEYNVCVQSVNNDNKVSGASNKVNFTTKFGIRPPSLTNLGANCYLNSALQAISSSNLLVDTVSDLSAKIGSEVKQLYVFNSLIQIMSGRVKINNSRRNRSSNRNFHGNYSSTEIEISRNPIFQNWCKTGQQDSFELISHMMNEVYQNIRKYLEDTDQIKKRSLSGWLKYKGLPLRIIIKYTILCACNDNVETPYQSDFALYVPIIDKTGSNELQYLVENYFNPDAIQEYECDNDDCDGSKATRIVKLVEPLPKTMCIHLQRSFWNGYRMQKINSNVTFTDKLIIKERYLLKEDKNTQNKDDEEVYCEYKLTAVIVHFGSVDSGHYVCYKRTGDDWYLTNDSWVNEVEREAVFTVEPYILLYETNEDLDELMKKRAENLDQSKFIQTRDTNNNIPRDLNSVSILDEAYQGPRSLKNHCGDSISGKNLEKSICSDSDVDESAEIQNIEKNVISSRTDNEGQLELTDL